jgi:hypothetical protein
MNCCAGTVPCTTPRLPDLARFGPPPRLRQGKGGKGAIAASVRKPRWHLSPGKVRRPNRRRAGRVLGRRLLDGPARTRKGGEGRCPGQGAKTRHAKDPGRQGLGLPRLLVPLRPAEQPQRKTNSPRKPRGTPAGSSAQLTPIPTPATIIRKPATTAMRRRKTAPVTSISSRQGKDCLRRALLLGPALPATGEIDSLVQDS